MKRPSISLPQELAWLLNVQDDEFEREFKLLALIKLCEPGNIFSGAAARTLDISRAAFLQVLGRYKVSVFSDSSPGQLQAGFDHA